MENPEKIEIEGLKTIHKLCKFGADHNMEGCTFTEIVERMFSKIEQMKAQVNTLDEMLLNQGEALAQAKAQAVPEGFVLVPREMQWHKADDLACLEWGRHVGLFYSENRDMSALRVEEFRLRWCKNKANKIMSDYKAMIEAQEPTK